MKKLIYCCVVMFILATLSFAVQAAPNYQRSSALSMWSWNSKSPISFGKLEPAPNTEGCNVSEYLIFGDKVLTFDISVFAKFAGTSFDVNKVYVDGIGSGGQYALGYWLHNWSEHGANYKLPAIEGLNWSGKNRISICVGSEVLF